MPSVFVIHEAHKKVTAIAELLAELQILESAHLKAIYEACKVKVKPPTFKSALYAGRLTKPMCDELSRLCNLIDEGKYDLLEDETFLDKTQAQPIREASTYPNYPGRDSPRAFAKKLRERYGLGPTVRVRAVQSNPAHLDSNLLAFEVDDSGQSTTLDEPLPLFFSVMSGIVRDPSGVTFGLNNVRIQLRPDDASEVRMDKRLSGAKLRDAKLSGEGLSKNATWTLRTKEGVALQGEYVTSDEPFCSLSNVRLGMSIAAIAATNILEPGSVVVTTPAEVESTTREVIKRLMEKSLDGNADTGGWKTLARQSLKISKA